MGLNITIDNIFLYKIFEKGKYPVSDRKAFQRYPEILTKYFATYDELINEAIM